MKGVFSWWTTKITKITVIPTIAILLLNNSAKADDPGACFMRTEDGRILDLGSLCGITPVKPVDTGVYRVPIKRRSGKTPVIDVTFNGKKTFEMIVDTGASGTLITQSMANALQIKPSGTVQASIADGSIIKLNIGQVNSMVVGGAKVSNIQVAIAPRAEIGLLGHDFFGNYDVKIGLNTIEFYRRDKQSTVSSQQ